MDVPVDCPCPPRADGERRHPDGDVIRLRETLDFRAGMTARNAIILSRQEDPDGDLSVAEALTILTEVYIFHGVESWTLVDEKGKPLPVTRSAIRERILSDPERTMTVGDAADEMYAEAVMIPLVRRGSRSSQPTPTDDSTSATNGSSPARPKPRKRSSISTTPTDGIAPTSPSGAGVYS